ncbi:MAG: hypothetical protein QNL04_06805 [SAR324 cluster bacterium]|nr:hypothetical protein [SAR324 cluster bacterium]
MKTFTKLIFAVALLSLTSCASQANKTHEVFEYKNADYRMLSESLEELKIAVEEGSTQEQYKAVVALRHISKHIDDPGKQELAVRGLVFLAAFGDDNQVTKRAESRLDWILFNGSPFLQMAVINAQRDLATGDLGLTKKDTSLFSNSLELDFILAGANEREAAVDFLVDRFENANEMSQYRMAGAFSVILANPKRCLEWEDAKSAAEKEKMAAQAIAANKAAVVADTTSDASSDTLTADTALATIKKKEAVSASGFICSDWDQSKQEDLKVELMSNIGDLLEDNDLSPQVATRLIMAVGMTDHLKVPEEKIKALDEMSSSMFISDERKLLLDAALNNAKSYYPDIFTSNFKKKADTSRSKAKTNKWTTVDPITMAKMLEKNRNNIEKVSSKVKINSNSFTRSANYKSLVKFNQRNFWINNAGPILENQLFNNNTGSVKEIPVGWLFFAGYDDSPESVEQKEILYFYSLKALKQGYVITGTKSLASLLKNSLDETEAISQPELTRRLQLIADSFASLKKNGEKVKSLLARLVAGVNASKDLYVKRLHLVALASAIPYYQTQAEPLACELFKELDTYSINMAENRVRGHKGFMNPYLTPEGKINKKSNQNTPSPKLCEKALFFHPTEPVGMIMPEVEEEESIKEEDAKVDDKKDDVKTTQTPK